jgi:translocation and assembly module TamB
MRRLASPISVGAGAIPPVMPTVPLASIDGTFAGPRAAVAGELRLVVGAAGLSAHGRLDLEHRSVDLVTTGTAPAMTPHPDLSWRSIAFDARIDGPFARPAVSAKLHVAALRAAGATVADIAGRVEGDAGTARLRGNLSGIRIPGPRPDLLAAAPVRIAAEARLDEADRPVHFSLAHPLVEADGDAATAGPQHGTIRLTLPDLAPLAALSGLDLDGHAVLNLAAAIRADTIRLERQWDGRHHRWDGAGTRADR